MHLLKLLTFFITKLFSKIIFQRTFTSTLQNTTTILTMIPLQASEPDDSIIDLHNLPSLEINADLAITQLEPISNVNYNRANSS